MALSHKIRFASQTDVGIKRSHNQDACSAQPAPDEKHFRAVGHVFVVADGMGGHAVGEKASAKAVREIPLTYQKHVGPEGPEDAIRRAFREANAGIYQIGAANPEFKGLGTTGIALFLRPEGVWIGHVGDSRVYRIREAAVEQLTFDHSWVWEMARRQGIDPDELGDFKRNVIIRSLGPEAEVEIDIEGPYPIEPGDSFLMCSDGLTNHVKPDELGAVVSTFPAAEACGFLVELANLRGGSDNITCLIVQVPRGDGTTSTGDDNPKPRSGMSGLLTWWGNRVSWPLTCLGLGGGLVALSIWMKMGNIPGFVVAFVLAAMLTLVGLGGLALQLRKKMDDGSEADDAAAARELHVYKSYPYAIDGAMSARFAELERDAKARLAERQMTYDEAAVAKLAAAFEAKAAAGDWPAAFRAKCQVVVLYAALLNKHQQKDEVFKPNWTTPFRPMNGQAG